MSRSQEIRAVGRLAGDVLVGVVDTVRDVHRAVARRVFAAVGPVAAPVRVVHDSITSGVYGVVRGAHAALPRGATAVAAVGAGLADQSPLSDSPPAGLILGVLNGLWGDTLAQRHPELALTMSVRALGGDVPTTVGGLAAAYPAATSRIAVFVPGLSETEQYWSLSARRHYGTEHSTHGSRLQHDLGYTPVYVRYNSGLHVSDNGGRLARLLDELVAGWSPAAPATTPPPAGTRAHRSSATSSAWVPRTWESRWSRGSTPPPGWRPTPRSPGRWPAWPTGAVPG